MILTVSKDLSFSTAVCDMLYFTGTLSAPATPIDAIFDLDAPYRAVLFVNRNEHFEEEELAEIISSYRPNIPIFSHGGYDSIHIKSINSVLSLSESVKAMQNTAKKLSLPPVGEYELFDFSASIDKSSVHYKESPIPLTKTETMILRTFISFYPEPVSPVTLLKFAFRSSRAPDIGSIRTHLSLMNKKIRNLLGFSAFEFTDAGYILNHSISIL